MCQIFAVTLAQCLFSYNLGKK